jgi:hypothetical protein
MRDVRLLDGRRGLPRAGRDELVVGCFIGSSDGHRHQQRDHRRIRALAPGPFNEIVTLRPRLRTFV